MYGGEWICFMVSIGKCRSGPPSAGRASEATHVTVAKKEGQSLSQLIASKEFIEGTPLLWSYYIP
jgi:hypothetical protein